MLALAPFARAVVPERHTTDAPVVQFQPAGAFALTVVRPATKPGIASFTTMPVVLSGPSLVMVSV
ncbi:hypothetical protein D9M68_988710 [compost metagenome]